MNNNIAGYLDAQEYPYTIVDTNVQVAGEAEGLSFFDSMATSSLVETTSVTADTSRFDDKDKVPVIKIPSPWFDYDGKPDIYVAVINNFGFIVYANGLDYSNFPVIVENGVNPIYMEMVGGDWSYAGFHPPLDGAITLNVNPTIDMVRTPATTVTKKYADGMVRISTSWPTSGVSGFSAHLQVDTHGNVFFFSTRSGYDLVADKIAGASRQLSFLGDLNPNQIYCLRSSVATASGVVYNPSGGVAPDCSVMAFDRSNGRLVGRAKSDTQGRYNIFCAASKGSKLFMVCLDDDGVAPDFNAQIVDRIIV
ncbi:hypothetical protein [Psychrobacter sp. 4Bb]|uniref:hypothetical protein n=1 Tax=Psychrobacter sp. 4Bb TaxID=888436 RepID=UPI000C7D5AC0|nr:hypothetical protein [Psychrobacter sp. 4Bb]PKH81158.1 hypothetical protein CXF60_06235 [Psychrobacter sp. 4Bb]